MRVTTDERQFLERDGILAAISSAARHAAQGSGRMLILEAAAGLGKTSVLLAAGPSMIDAGLTVHRARGLDLERAFPYGVVRQLLERSVLTRAVRDTVMVGAARGASAVLGVSEDDVAAASIDQAAATAISPFQVLHGLYWTVSNLGDTHPIALVIDDAHDADAETLLFLAYLAPRVADLRLLVLIATRPPDQAPDSRRLQELFATYGEPLLHLEPLSEVAVGGVITRRLGQAPDAEFRATVSSATGGNPFYLGELLGEVAERNLLPIAENAVIVRNLGPPTILRSVLFRLAVVPAALPVARACAVLGEGMRLTTIARLAGVTTSALVDAADRLIAARILAPGPTVRFAHPIIEAAILADLGTNDRARWHANAADLLLDLDADPQIVGLHLLRAVPAGNQSWVAVLRRAGQTAAASGTPDAAAEFLRRALAEPPQEATMTDVRFELGAVEASAGSPKGIELMADAVAATTEPRLGALRSLVLADYQTHAGAITAAVATLDDALVRLGDTDADLSLDIEIERYWCGHLQLHVVAAPDETYRRLHKLANGPDDARRRRLWCYLSIDAARMSSREEAWDFADRALSPPGPLAFVSSESTCVAMLVLSLAVLERNVEFDALVDDVLAEVARSGQQVGHLVISTFRAMAYLARGDLLEAEREAEETIRATTMAGWGHGAPGTTAILAAALLDQGRQPEAASLLQASPFGYEPVDYPTALLLTVRGRMKVELGVPTAGLTDLLQAGRAMTELGVLNPGMIDWRLHAVRALLALGRNAEAEDLARENLDLARQASGPITVGAAIRVRATTLVGPERLALLDEAIRVLRPSKARLQLAHALLAMGMALRQDARPRAARQALAEAFDLATRCHALQTAELARAELLAGGARPRRRPVNPDELTPSEVRVARLALRGMSNKAIAQTLYVSRKTVEKHLANTYRKLQISSRQELSLDALVAERRDED